MKRKFEQSPEEDSEMAVTRSRSQIGGFDGERAGENRSPKRQQRHPPLEVEEEENEDSDAASVGEEEEENEDSDAGEEEENEDCDAASVGEEEENEDSDAASIGEEEENEDCDAASVGEEEENEDSDAVSVGEEEENEDSGAASVGKEEVVCITRMATVGNGSQDGESGRSDVKLRNSVVLDCPTCCEPLKSPIYQCRNGDLACSSCCKKLKKKCSICKSPIGDIRCRAMEKIVEATIVTCANAIYGCTKTTTYGSKLSDHEKNECVFTRCYCPVPDCNYVGSYEDLKSHSLATHSDHEHSRIYPFRFSNPTMFAINLDKCKTVVLQEEKEGDLFVVEAFKGSSNGYVYVTVSRIAPPGVGNYSCSLARPDQSRFRELRVGMIVKKIQKVVLEEKQEADLDFDDKYGGFLLIPSKELSTRCYWKMEIRISRGGYGYFHI